MASGASVREPAGADVHAELRALREEVRALRVDLGRGRDGGGPG